MKITYLAAVYRCDRNPARYVAVFPDILADATKLESSFEDLHEDAAKVLEKEINRLVQAGEPLPPATADYKELVRKSKLGKVGMVMPVTVFIKPKTVPVCVSIPEDKLKDIDDFASERGVPRSVLVTEAVVDYIRRTHEQ